MSIVLGKKFCKVCVNRPGEKIEALCLDPREGLLACEGRSLELDLIGDSVHCYIAVLREGDVVLFPFLLEALGHKLLEDFAPVVDALGASFFEVLNGTEHLGVEEQSELLVIGGAEADGVAAATRGAVEAQDGRQGFRGLIGHVDQTLVREAEDVVVREGSTIVSVDEREEEGSVRHGRFSFAFLDYSIADKSGIVNGSYVKSM